MIPTREQTEKLWKWCGLHKQLATDGQLHWFTKDGEIVSPVDSNGDPIIDPTNLFKYTVPRLEERHICWEIKGQVVGKGSDKINYSLVLLLFQKKVFWKFTRLGIIAEGDIDPALALFWAVYKVIEYERAINRRNTTTS